MSDCIETCPGCESLQKQLWHERDRHEQDHKDLLERQRQVKNLEEQVERLDAELKVARSGQYKKRESIMDFCDRCGEWHERGALTACMIQNAVDHCVRNGEPEAPKMPNPARPWKRS